jgi:hypothetical protein
MEISESAVDDQATIYAAVRAVAILLTFKRMSASGHGGPMLSPETMGRLSDLGVGIWFDIYFHGE